MTRRMTPSNPFQNAGPTRGILPRQSSHPVRSTLTKVFRQACWVITIGAILVTALAWVVPPAPSGKLAAPVPTQAALRGVGARKGGGVRGQSKLSTDRIKSSKSKAFQHKRHWDADALHQQGESEDFENSETSADHAPIQKPPVSNVYNTTGEDETDVGEGFFGRKDDENVGENTKSAQGEGDGNGEDHPVVIAEKRLHAAPTKDDANEAGSAVEGEDPAGDQMVNGGSNNEPTEKIESLAETAGEDQKDNEHDSDEENSKAKTSEHDSKDGSIVAEADGNEHGVINVEKVNKIFELDPARDRRKRKGSRLPDDGGGDATRDSRDRRHDKGSVDTAVA